VSLLISFPGPNPFSLSFDRLKAAVRQALDMEENDFDIRCMIAYLLLEVHNKGKRWKERKGVGNYVVWT
jgi:hypothetical protein